MICIILHPIQLFYLVSMSHRQLSYEEANQLCEAALILICQQNIAKKQKSHKNKNSPFISPLSTPLPSPSKTSIKDTRHQDLLSSNIQHCLDFQKSPFKKVIQTPQKSQMEKESSIMDMLDFSQEIQFKLTEKQESCVGFVHRTSIMSQKDIKISTQQSVESFQKVSQMLQEQDQQLYTENQVKDLKRDLQIQSRGKICKTQNLDSQTGQIVGYQFLCKNDGDCTFDCFLEYTGKRTQKGEKVYRLVRRNETHLKTCIEEEEELTFMKLTKLIDSMENSIRKLLSQDLQLKPKDILTRIAQELGENDHNFIYKGLQSKHYHKAAKKYFDNLIYKVKNPGWSNS